MIGKYDAAVIDQEERQAPRSSSAWIVRACGRSRRCSGAERSAHGTEGSGAGATSEQAGLVVVGEPTIDRAFAKAVTASEPRSSSARWTPRATKSPTS